MPSDVDPDDSVATDPPEILVPAGVDDHPAAVADGFAPTVDEVAAHEVVPPPTPAPPLIEPDRSPAPVTPTPRAVATTRPAAVVDRARQWVGDFRFDSYVVLCLVLFALMLSFVIKGRWAGGIDIWEHSAAAREFARNPLNPAHPLFGIDRPHQFLNPYTLVVGLFSRFTGLSVVTALNLAGLANLVLFFVTLRLFVRKLTGRAGVEFWALLFILTLWGPGAWFFSGFLHFNVIALVLTYPATFAKGVVFLALCAHLAYLRRNRPVWLIPVALASTVVVICHPVDAVFLWIGMGALTGTIPTPRRDRAIGLTLLAIGGSFALALLWPHFSVYELLFGDSTKPFRDAIGAGDRDMYHRPLIRLFPALVVVPFAVYRLRRWRSDPLVLMFAGTVLAYAYGYAIANHSFGRLISNATMVGAIILGEEVVKVVTTADRLGPAGQPIRNFAIFMSCTLAVFGLWNVRNGFEVLPERYVRDLPYDLLHNEVDLVPISMFDFVADNADDYPMAISDLYTSMEIPTFGPRVLAYARFQAFVDMTERDTDYRRFFDPASTDDVRREVIRKYGVALLVLTNQSVQSDAVSQRIATLGRTVSTNERFTFVDVRDALGVPTPITAPATAPVTAPVTVAVTEPITEPATVAVTEPVSGPGDPNTPR